MARVHFTKSEDGSTRFRLRVSVFLLTRDQAENRSSLKSCLTGCSRRSDSLLLVVYDPTPYTLSCLTQATDTRIEYHPNESPQPKWGTHRSPSPPSTIHPLLSPIPGIYPSYPPLAANSSLPFYLKSLFSLLAFTGIRLSGPLNWNTGVPHTHEQHRWFRSVLLCCLSFFRLSLSWYLTVHHTSFFTRSFTSVLFLPRLGIRRLSRSDRLFFIISPFSPLFYLSGLGFFSTILEIWIASIVFGFGWLNIFHKLFDVYN